MKAQVGNSTIYEEGQWSTTCLQYVSYIWLRVIKANLIKILALLLPF